MITIFKCTSSHTLLNGCSSGDPFILICRHTSALGQSGPGSNGDEGVLYIPQSSSITRTSPSDCLVSYISKTLVGGVYPSAEMQSVYSTGQLVTWVDLMSLRPVKKHPIKLVRKTHEKIKKWLVLNRMSDFLHFSFPRSVNSSGNSILYLSPSILTL